MEGCIYMHMYAHSVESLFTVVMFRKVTTSTELANTELANTDPLFLVETQG